MLTSNSLPCLQGHVNCYCQARPKCLPGILISQVWNYYLLNFILKGNWIKIVHTDRQGEEPLEMTSPVEVQLAFVHTKYTGDWALDSGCKGRHLKEPAAVPAMDDPLSYCMVKGTSILWALMTYSSATSEIHTSSLLSRNQPCCFQFPKACLQHDDSAEVPTAAVEFQGKPTSFSMRTESVGWLWSRGSPCVAWSKEFLLFPRTEPLALWWEPQAGPELFLCLCYLGKQLPTTRGASWTKQRRSN